MDALDRHGRQWWLAILVATLGGLVLRIAAARGGLWTDEAWSMIYAAEARDAAGVFLRINHDNNHHLMSLWLQAVGPGAPPLLARLPAIVAGTLSIPVAALILVRRSALAGIVAAVLVAISPIMINYGSEARGYGPMLLAALVTIWLAVEAADGHERRGTPWWLALAALFGMLSNLTMAATVGSAALWLYLDARARAGPRSAMKETARVMGPALVVTFTVIVAVFLIARTSPTGMQLGGYRPFGWTSFFAALSDVAGWTLGLTFHADWVAPLLVGLGGLWLAIRPPAWLGNRAPLYAILILAVPFAAALLHPGNSEFARYYLASAVGLLLLASELIAHGIRKGGLERVLTIILTLILLAACLHRDRNLIALERGQIGRAVALIAERSPNGATVALDPKRLEAGLNTEAARRHFPIRFAHGCEPADVVFAAHDRWEQRSPTITRCGIPLHAIASSRTSTLTGDAWILYAPERLPSSDAPVSGPAHGASNPPFPAERA